MSHRMKHSPIYKLGDLAGESIATLRNAAIVAAEAHKHFHVRQIEEAREVFSENSRQFRADLKYIGETSAALVQWSTLIQSRMLKLARIGGTWAEKTSQTIADMSELLVVPLPVSGTAGQQSASIDTTPVPERRMSATMIQFPERRAAMLSMNAAPSAETLARKRSA
jgi:hypothetical protein